MPIRQFYKNPGTFTWGPVPAGTGTISVKSKNWASGAGGTTGADGSTGTHVATSSETFTLPAGAFNVSMTAEGKGGDGNHGLVADGGGGGGGGGKGVTAAPGATSITITISGGDATGDDGAGHIAIGYHGVNASATSGGAGGSFSGDSGTNGSAGSNASGTTGGNGGNSGAGSAGGVGGTSGNNGSPGGNFGGGGGGGGLGAAGGLGGDAAVTVTWTNANGGGAGGGGAYAERTFDVAVGESLTLFVPAGGAADTDGDYATTTLSTGSVIKVKADKGLKGSGVTGGLGGLATNCVGSSAFDAGNGGAGVSGGGGGGGGGSGGDAAAGSNGANGSSTTGGSGGTGGAAGGASGGHGGDSGNPGLVGVKPGGGGGGGGHSVAGAAGADGQIVLEWDPPDGWFWTGCYCCLTMLPDNFDLITSAAGLPIGLVGQPPPCGVSSVQFAQANGWSKVLNETVWTGGSVGTGDAIVVPLAWKSARIGPFGTCGDYVTIWIWCNLDGNLPYGGPPSTTGYNRPGVWHCCYLWEMSSGYTPPLTAQFGDDVTDVGRVDIGSLWPCDFECDVTVGPDGSFVVIFNESNDLGRLIDNFWCVFGLVPVASGGKCGAVINPNTLCAGLHI